MFLARRFCAVLEGGLTPRLLPGVRGWHLPTATCPLSQGTSEDKGSVPVWEPKAGWAGLAPTAAAPRSCGHSKPGINTDCLNESCSSGCKGLVTSCEGGQVWVDAGGNEGLTPWCSRTSLWELQLLNPSWQWRDRVWV